MRSRNEQIMRDQVYGDHIQVYRDATTDTGQAITINPYETLVEIHLTDGTNTATATATLPPVSKAKGQRVTVVAVDCAGGITLQDQDDSENWSDLTLDTDADRATLESNGYQWVVVENAIA